MRTCVTLVLVLGLLLQGCGGPSVKESDFSKEYLIGLTYGGGGFTTYYDSFSADLIVCTNHDLLISMPKKLNERSVEEYGVIATLKLTDEQYANIEKVIDRKKIYFLDPEPDNDVMDGSCAFLYLYDKDQKVMQEIGGYMPSSEQFLALQRTVYENIPLDEVRKIREEQVKKLEQDAKKRRGGA